MKRRSLLGLLASCATALHFKERHPELRIVVSGEGTQNIRLYLDGVDVSFDVPISWEPEVRAARPGDVLHLTRFARDSQGKHFAEYRMPGRPWRNTRSGAYGVWNLPGMESRIAVRPFSAVVVA